MEVLEHSHPSYQDCIPDPSSMNIDNMGSGGSLTSNTCNGTSKTRHIIVENVHKAAGALRKNKYDDIRVLEVDCWNHLRNVWLGVITKELSNSLGNTLRVELDEIDSQIRFLTRI